MKRKLPALLIFPMLGTLFFLFSCKTINYSVSQDWQEENFFVAAQEASDNDNYEQALFYYQVYITRYPENYRKVLAAQYETGFIYYKKGKYKKAKSILESVLEQYSTSPNIVLLEERYKILSEKVLKRMEEKKNKSPFKKKEVS